MLKVRSKLDLLEKAIRAEDGRELGVKNLYRNFAVMPNVFSDIDSRHAALTDLALDPIPVAQTLSETFGSAGHEEMLLPLPLSVRNRASDEHRDVVLSACVEGILK